MDTLPDPRTLDSLSAWDIAKLIGCHYSGDSNTIEYGGVFYDPRDWQKYGYANCVELWIDPDSKEDTLRITIGTIHRDSDMSGPFSCIGHNPDNLDQHGEPIPADTLTHIEIEACRYYSGIEPDDYQEFQRSYKLAHWKEWRIWKSLLPILSSLSR